jgi:hypothetical protein
MFLMLLIVSHSYHFKNMSHSIWNTVICAFFKEVSVKNRLKKPEAFIQLRHVELLFLLEDNSVAQLNYK